MQELIGRKRKRTETVEAEAGKKMQKVGCTFCLQNTTQDMADCYLKYLYLLFSDNCSSGQSSQACTPNGDDNPDGSSGVGSDVASSNGPSSFGTGLKNGNENSSYQTNMKLSPTKTLIQKFNNIGLETNSSNIQTERQKPSRYVQNLSG